MQRDSRAFLWDALNAADAVLSFVRGKTRQDLEQDLLLASAVERQLEIIGEALGQLARRDPGLAQQVPDLPRIVAFRNIFVHGYATVDHAIVWRAIQHRPTLRDKLNELLGEA